MVRKITFTYFLFLVILFNPVSNFVIDNNNLEDPLSSASPRTRGEPEDDNSIRNYNGIFDTKNNQIRTKEPKKSQTQGDYKTRGFFAHMNKVNLDEDGEVYEWESYDQVKDNSSSTDWSAFCIYDSRPPSIPDIPDKYYLMPDYRTTDNYEGGERGMNSSIFSPVFEEETMIKGKVFFYMGRLYVSYGYPTYVFTLRITLQLYNPADQSTSDLLIIEEVISSYSGEKTFTGQLPAPVTIPAGYRLKLKYEGKFNQIPPTPYIYFYGVYKSSGYSDTWTIDDSEDQYDSTYTLNNFRYASGVQLYMYKEKYPSVDISGVSNDTIYYESKNVTISTSDSVLDKYRWDFDDYQEFDSPITTSLPETTGWHYLSVISKDEFDNEVNKIYRVGFDNSIINVELHSPANGSLITDGQLLNFSCYEIDSATYAWDSGGNFSFTAPYDLYPSSGFNGEHNLSIFTVDGFGEEEHKYVFNFDNAAPITSLINVENNTQQPLSKQIDVDIIDQSQPISVEYNWDGLANSSWNPQSGTLYRTYVPDTEEWHILNIYATDDLGFTSYTRYRFFTNTSYLLVELRSMENNSFYYGGNDIEITITGDNGTVQYKWGSDPYNDGTVTDGLLILNETDALSTTVGEYYLYIKVFDIIDNPYIFTFKFTVDQSNPTISVEENYNNKRFREEDIFNFTIIDDWNIGSELEVLISIDSGTNITLSNPFDFSLLSIEEGNHNLTIYAFDIARNNDSLFFNFTIDNTGPIIDILYIENLATLADGTKYIPANSLIQCNFTDSDYNNISAYYSINSSNYIEFTENITINSNKGSLVVKIIANDSLNNTNEEIIEFIVDTQAPLINILSLQNNSVINEYSVLEFEASDNLVETIDEILIKWDKSPTTQAVQPSIFTVELSALYTQSESDYAILNISSIDIVGNNRSYFWHFIVDRKAPELELINHEDGDYINGDTILDFNVPDTDLKDFIYKWDEEDFSPAFEPWDIEAPTKDGIHNLTVILVDATNSFQPNSEAYNFQFIVDDIELKFSDGFENNSLINLLYKDYFNFTVNIFDSISNDSVDNLLYLPPQDNGGLKIVYDYNAKQYNFSIQASAIGNITLVFSFATKDSKKHKAVVSFEIEKRKGKIDFIWEQCVNTVTYEEDIIITLALKDENDLNQIVGSVIINDTLFYSTAVGGNIFKIVYSSKNIGSKGNYSLQIEVLSDFYYAQTDENNSFEIEILPIQVNLDLDIPDTEIIEGNTLGVTATLTFLNGTPVVGVHITIYMFIYYESGTELLFALQNPLNETGPTNNKGQFKALFQTNETFDKVSISAIFTGTEILDIAQLDFEDQILIIPPPTLSTWLIWLIVGASIVFALIISIVVYKLTKPKPFQVLMDSIDEEEVQLNLIRKNPGIVLSIFDQSRGPIPLVKDHSLDTEYYLNRMQIGVENFLLRISDQAYSSLGFEEHTDERRTGSIRLPNERMVALTYGIQLENKEARGSFENLTLITLVNRESGKFLLRKQEYIYPEMEKLYSLLKTKKPLPEIEEQIHKLRLLATRIILAAEKEDKISEQI